MEPWVVFPVTGLAILLLYLGILTPFYAPAMTLLSIVVGIGMRKRRRGKTRNHVFAELNRCISEYSVAPPHLIAHSLGTLLGCECLEEQEAIHFNHVILTGSVLPSTYDFRHYLSDRISRIRNEVGRNDWVPKLAAFGHRLGLREYGGAGYKGFSCHLTDYPVHTIDSGSDVCTDCAYQEAQIHNVIFEKFVHSSCFTLRAHAVAYWLPFLLNVDASEFWKLIRLCHAVEEAKRAKNQDYLSLIDELGYVKWKWIDNRNLREEIRIKMIAFYDFDESKANSYLGIIIQRLSMIINDAYKELHEPNNPNVQKLRCLYPGTAVVAAIETVVTTA